MRIFYPDLVWLSLIIDRCLIKLIVKHRAANSTRPSLLFSLLFLLQGIVSWYGMHRFVFDQLFTLFQVFQLTGHKVKIFVKQFANEVRFLSLFQNFQIARSTMFNLPFDCSLAHSRQELRVNVDLKARKLVSLQPNIET